MGHGPHSDLAARYLTFTYEVGGEIYTHAFRSTAEHLDRRVESSPTLTIQYDPVRPKRVYYARACKLANHFIFGTAVVAGIAFVVLMKI